MKMSNRIRVLLLGIAVAGIALFNLFSTSQSNTLIHRQLAFFDPIGSRNLKTVTTLSGATIEIEEGKLQAEKQPCLPRGRRRLGMFNPNVDVSTLPPCEEEKENVSEEETTVTVTLEEEPRSKEDYIRSENAFVEAKQPPEESSAVTVEEKPQKTTSEVETMTTKEESKPQSSEGQPSIYEGMMDYWSKMSYSLSGETTLVGLDTIATAAQNLEAKKQPQQESTETVVAATEKQDTSSSSQVAASAMVEEDNSNGEYASDHVVATALELELEDIEAKGAEMIADLYAKYGVPTTRRR